jgi:hypothetical protein
MATSVLGVPLRFSVVPRIFASRLNSLLHNLNREPRNADLVRQENRGGRQSVGVVVREGIEQNTVDDAANRGGRANAQGKRQDSDDRRAGVLPQHPQPIAKVLAKARHLLHTLATPIDFLYPLKRFGASTFVKPRYETTVERVDHPNR